MKEFTDNQLITELERRGYVTRLLFSVLDVKHDSLSESDKNTILSQVDFDYHTSEINEEIENLISDYIGD